MSDLLSGLGLQPDSGDTPAAASEPEPTSPPSPPAPAAEPAPIPELEQPIEIPEGAKNPDAVQRLIEAERKNAREANARRRELEQQLQERVEAALPLEQRIAAATKRAEEAEHRALRFEIGLAHKLPTEMVDRLKGTTKDEIQADAQSLLSFLKQSPSGLSADGGFQTPPAVQPDPAKAHNNLLVGLLTGRSGA